MPGCVVLSLFFEAREASLAILIVSYKLLGDVYVIGYLLDGSVLLGLYYAYHSLPLVGLNYDYNVGQCF